MGHMVRVSLVLACMLHCPPYVLADVVVDNSGQVGLVFPLDGLEWPEVFCCALVVVFVGS